MSDIATRVKKIIVDKLGVEEAEVTNEASFTNDLGADSLDTVELIMEFEKEFNISIPDDGNSYPTLSVTWDEEKFGFTVAQCDEQLRRGTTHRGADAQQSERRSGAQTESRLGGRSSRTEQAGDYLHDSSAGRGSDPGQPASPDPEQGTQGAGLEASELRLALR